MAGKPESRRKREAREAAASRSKTRFSNADRERILKRADEVGAQAGRLRGCGVGRNAQDMAKASSGCAYTRACPAARRVERGDRQG